MDTTIVDSYSHISKIELRLNQGHLHQIRVNGGDPFVPFREPDCIEGIDIGILTLTP